MELKKRHIRGTEGASREQAEAVGMREPAGPAVANGRPRGRPERRSTLAWRTRDAGAAAVGTVGIGAVMLARLVMTLATLIALLIGLAIVLVDVSANAGNSIVQGIHEAANFFAGSFTGLIRFTGHPKRAITVDWGIALVVYTLVGAVVARVIANVGRGGMRFERRHRSSATSY